MTNRVPLWSGRKKKTVKIHMLVLDHDRTTYTSKTSTQLHQCTERNSDGESWIYLTSIRDSVSAKLTVFLR
jgi:hypothetical protein